MKTVTVFLALALSALAAAAYADPPARVGRLNHIAGTVSFAPAEAPEEWSHAIVNRPLMSGDRLWTDHGARAELHVGATAVRLAPLTNLDILHLDDDRLQLRLAQGSANLRVREIDANDVIELVTPAGTVVVRQPGSYRVSADPNSAAVRMTVHFGEAEVLGAAQSIVVPSGQAATFAHGGGAVFEVAAYAPSDEFDRWSAERDRREDAVVSRRYISPHMTGYEDLDDHGSWRTVAEYGAVWIPARVASDWAPYRHGHWTWISPWGWTWIDDAPWGFAPSHYGRWVRVHDHWAWAPGPIVRRPVYAPALVAFVGGSNWAVSLHSGPSVGWFPLGWREPYRPWYRASHAHVRRVNVTHVTNIYNTEVRHVHRSRPEAVTVVRRNDFVSARAVSRSRLRLAHADLEHAEVLRDRQPAERVRSRARAEWRAEQTAPTRAAARAPMGAAAAETERPHLERRESRAEQRIERTAPPAVTERRARADAQRESVARQRERIEPPRAAVEPQRVFELSRPIVEPPRARPRLAEERAQQQRERAGAHREERPHAGMRVRERRERVESGRQMAPQASEARARAERPRWDSQAATQRAERTATQSARVMPQAAQRTAPAATPATPVAAPVRQAPARDMSPRAQQRSADGGRGAEHQNRRTHRRQANGPPS